VYLFSLFLVLNFGGLALGNWFMGDAVNGAWYDNLNKAPWTPPGWVFGVVWSLIMLCFSWYLTALFSQQKSIKLMLLYVFQFTLNVSWNYLFFNQQLTIIALIGITMLTLVLFYFFFAYQSEKIKYWRLLLMPYMVWLCIATSLNAYVVLYN
jgi:tryptophan-rich sensory protein